MLFIIVQHFVPIQQRFISRKASLADICVIAFVRDASLFDNNLDPGKKFMLMQYILL